MSMSEIDERCVVLPSGRVLDLHRSRWDGVLDREEFTYCRQHGIALAFDCAQTGWVVGTCTDDLESGSPRAPSSEVRPVVEPPGPPDPRQHADQLRRSIVAAAERHLEDVRAGLSRPDEAETSLADLVDRTVDEFAAVHGLALADSFHFALQSHLVAPVRALRATDDLWAARAPAFEFRSWTADDVDVYMELLGNPNVWEYMPEPFPSPFDREIARTLIEIGSIGFHHDTVAVVVDGRPVGQCLLRFDEPLAGVRTAEVAYWLGEEHWGKGWMSRILPLFTERSFGRHHVDVIYAWIMTANQPSIHVAERAGYRRDRCSLEPRVAESLGRSDYVRYAAHRSAA